ncbi:hypothetical protein PVK06_024353 [Gossypium arboreum]|uniref:Uncharacterized protein n=1 Tax=Gossypium arboreum TaxID=29729 RepID=A0ABR0PDR6_GOSAR|nr:hypothetical protein PVK06_024353 [Gossypium arboreum]
MHKSDRVMWQFGWRQNIPSPSQDIEALHKLDSRGKTDKDWQEFYKEHIDIWDLGMISYPCANLFAHPASTPSLSVFSTAPLSLAYYALMAALMLTPTSMYLPTAPTSRYYLQPAYATMYTYPQIVLQTPLCQFFTKVAHIRNYLLVK